MTSVFYDCPDGDAILSADSREELTEIIRVFTRGIKSAPKQPTLKF